MTPDDDADPDVVLGALGAELAAAITAALPGWVVRSVERRRPGDDGLEPALAEAAQQAGAAAASDLGPVVTDLLGSDVDAQRATPLQVVRTAVRYPTAVLRAAGVAPVPRDRFAQERFPADPYGLTPASLEDLDPTLGELALRWGAAKARAHRGRHRGFPGVH